MVTKYNHAIKLKNKIKDEWATLVTEDRNRTDRDEFAIDRADGESVEAIGIDIAPEIGGFEESSYGFRDVDCYERAVLSGKYEPNSNSHIELQEINKEKIN